MILYFKGRLCISKLFYFNDSDAVFMQRLAENDEIVFIIVYGKLI